MRGFDLDGGAFFMCTEISPRCYTIQQVSDVDGALKQFANRRYSQASSSAFLPPSSTKPSVPRRLPFADVSALSSCVSNSSLPMLPWWFTAECRQELMGVPPPNDERAVTPDTRPPSSVEAQPLGQEQLEQRIQRQLEYYFSRENLVNDRYLRCQMDADQYVPIKIVANFPKIAKLTTDLGLIVEVLKSSPQLQVDESGQKVRPMSKRCTIILREIPKDADEKEVKAMFGDDCPPHQTISYGLNNSWYVTFASEEDTQKALFHLQTLGKTFNGNPVFARIKTGGAPIGADVHGQQTLARGNTHIPLTLNGGALRGQLIVHHVDQWEHNRSTPSPSNSREENKGAGNVSKDFDLGQILAQNGYLPRATFRPLASPTPLQSAAVAQPTSFFTQPILHNGDHRLHCCASFLRFHQIFRRHFSFPLRLGIESVNGMAKNEEEKEADDQTFLLEILRHHCDEGKCCGQCFEMNFDGTVSDCFGQNAFVTWKDKEEIRFFRKRKRRRAKSEPAFANCPTHFAVGRNEYVLRQCAKEENRRWDPDQLVATMLPSPVPRITDVPRLNVMGGVSTKEGGVDETVEKHCSTPTGGAFAGFQRQESVEAYQIAVAANGVAKQRRMTLEIEEEEEDQWEAVSNRKIRRKSMEKHQQNRQFHNSANSPKVALMSRQNSETEQHSDRQLWRLFGDRSTNLLQPRPLCFSVNYQKHRENSHYVSAKNSAFLTTNRTPIQEFAKVAWTNESIGKLAMPMHQFTPKVQNRVVQPLLSLTSATFSPLNFQQQRGPSCKGTNGGRRTIAEIGRRNGGRRGRTWTNEWGRTAVTAESNFSNHPTQQSFVGMSGLKVHCEEAMVREKEHGTMKRANEREGNGRETEAHHTMRQSRTKTMEQKRPLQAQQNDTTILQRQHFRRHSGETMDKDARCRTHSLAKEASNGIRQEQTKEGQQKLKFNFEEREFPALLSCAFASGNFTQIGHSHRNPSNYVALPSVDSQTTSSALSNVSIGAASSNIVQLQFSAVVAGNGRRRATIGTTTAESARKGTGAGSPPTTDDRSIDGAVYQQRSSTIGAAEKSYAQMLKGWPQ